MWLGKNKSNLDILIEKNVDGIIIVGSEGILSFMNPAAESIFGGKAENLIGTPIGFPMISSKAQEIEVLGRDGVQRIIEMRAASIDWEEKDAFLVSLHDITERKQAETNLRKSMLGAIQAIVAIVELKDPYTAGHQRRVSTLALAIAQEMELPPDQIEGIRIAGMIHDMGKVNIPGEIISKTGKISALELNVFKEHPQSGYNILQKLDFPWPLDQITLQHHERMDGSGYPRNLKGDEILIEARIIAVADVVEAMSSHRPYRPALELNVALEEIEMNSGVAYDNNVADICLKLFREKGFQFEGNIV
jgi:HD-GYP domain-containing protein (c-di-GMP phosphodiesterase class II)